MPELLILSLTALIVLFVGLILFIKYSKSRDAEAVAPPNAAGEPAGRPAPRGVQLVGGPGVRGRRRPPAGGARQRLGQRVPHDSDEEEEEDVEGEQDENVAFSEEKVGAKKQRKLEEKAARKAQREAELQEREEKKKQEEKLEKLRKKEELKREAEEAAKAAEEQKLKEEKERKEHEEYLKLKEEFSIDSEGLDAEEQQDEQSLLQEFISYVKNTKVVMLEDLAAHFKIKTQDAIDRIKTLQEDGTLSGVIDDRGKFVYITAEEYEAVARFIKQRGRVSIAELAESMNRLIVLTPESMEKSL